MPIDPGTLASLQGTLTPQGVLSVLQAEQERQEKELAARTAQATQEAQQASTAFSGAAAAPVQEPDALAQLIPLLTGNIASVIGRTPAYREHGEETVAERRKNLKQQRMDNLSALKSIWDRKAEAAQRAGDFESEQNARMKSEQLSKVVDVMLEAEHHKNALGEIHARGEEDRATNAAKLTAETGAAQTQAFDSLVYTTRAGNRFLDLTNVNTPKKKDLAVAYAAANGLTPVDKNTATQLRTADEVYNGLDRVESMLSTVLPHQTGNKVKDFLTRQARGASNLASRVAQSNSTPAAFASTMPLAIRSLQAVAAGPGSGFRLNQAEINMIQRRWPQLNDNIETAQAKLQWERWFLQNKEESYFKRDWRPTPEPAIPGLPPTGITPAAKASEFDAYRKSK